MGTPEQYQTWGLFVAIWSLPAVWKQDQPVDEEVSVSEVCAWWGFACSTSLETSRLALVRKLRETLASSIKVPICAWD